MTHRHRRRLALATAAAAMLALAAACDTFYLLRGTLNGDCDAPPVTNGVDGGAAAARRANCQPPGAVCCRRSTAATRTSCQYPEDCYIAPFGGPYATAVDCAYSHPCNEGSCQCRAGGPPCESPTTHLVTCCAAAERCDATRGVCAGS